jgi:hypothetical protein
MSESTAPELKKYFSIVVACSFLMSIGMIAHAFVPYSGSLYDLVVLAYIVLSYPVAISLQWRLCGLYSIPRHHMFLYVLNPIIAWVAFYWMTSSKGENQAE